jgi:hypothetical protein
MSEHIAAKDRLISGSAVQGFDLSLVCPEREQPDDVSQSPSLVTPTSTARCTARKPLLAQPFGLGCLEDNPTRTAPCRHTATRCDHRRAVASPVPLSANFASHAAIDETNQDFDGLDQDAGRTPARTRLVIIATSRHDIRRQTGTSPPHPAFFSHHLSQSLRTPSQASSSSPP